MQLGLVLAALPAAAARAVQQLGFLSVGTSFPPSGKQFLNIFSNTKCLWDFYCSFILAEIGQTGSEVGTARQAISFPD